MQFITATQDVSFQNPVYGEGTLVRGKTYYTFGQFARETAAQGLARIVDESREILHFKPLHLDMDGGPRKILLYFSGGLGDAVTVGIILPLAEKKHGLFFDICCALDKWDYIFKPMGMRGRHFPFPPDLQVLSSYDSVLADLTDFYPSKDGLRVSPVIQLLQGFRLEDSIPDPRYEIPHEVRLRCRLEPPEHFRIGVNFDSQGLVKSYPVDLQNQLLTQLCDAELEVFLFGARQSSIAHPPLPVRDFRGRTSIPELAAMVDQMDIILGVDSFIAHLSNVLARPTVVILSTTSNASFKWHRHITCISSRLGCTPCYALFEKCPKQYPECRAFAHESISPEIIAKTIMERLHAQSTL